MSVAEGASATFCLSPDVGVRLSSTVCLGTKSSERNKGLELFVQGRGTLCSAHVYGNFAQAWRWRMVASGDGYLQPVNVWQLAE